MLWTAPLPNVIATSIKEHGLVATRQSAGIFYELFIKNERES